ncbi:hypothetical protein [Duganella vulcania]|uniref:Uncharacterized protein n=1 Tax=Duganella vulcania TaxID=2692166 RepID=A0A845GJ50_9BURK|nr:hypothetical protein [Duganella vulcania]MYM92767.1 hypothetical protein [Duganella vulcania]
MKFPFGPKPQPQVVPAAPKAHECRTFPVVQFRKMLDNIIAAEAMKAPIATSLFPKHFLDANPVFKNKMAQRVVGVAWVELNEPAGAFAFLMRFIAMQKILLMEEIKPWMPESNGTVGALHPAFFEVVASMELSPGMEFDKDKFFAKLGALDAEMDIVDINQPPDQTPQEA